jgi:hypothetical protein
MVGVEVSLHAVFTSLLDGSEWSTSLPGHSTLGKELCYQLKRKSGGSQSRCGHFGEEGIVH